MASEIGNAKEYESEVSENRYILSKFSTPRVLQSIAELAKIVFQAAFVGFVITQFVTESGKNFLIVVGLIFAVVTGIFYVMMNSLRTEGK